MRGVDLVALRCRCGVVLVEPRQGDVASLAGLVEIVYLELGL
jgi:hypothetical protein